MAKKFAKDKVLELGTRVSVATHIIFPGRRDPYNWESAIVIARGTHRTGEKVVKCRVWHHFDKSVTECWYFVGGIEPYKHYERDIACRDFAMWADEQKDYLEA